ncbi:MAG: hypothetical protein L0K41_09980 [Yaniella sp.]|uniref:hypothetical protein n=1 Tax=Yaniella sp. TaxID=2773929 RepID=UPI0026490BD9|nr:hypothetical protein [Yaniella sp.]MDN5838802.1 hypothetical protein [Yaniella sp.]MDN6358500.1 hypothetical protein [Yaniella sp.]MDN6409968.1 hypothetical protein [Yaniella sp.]MDN6490713.1 hypothetical protein [Yaniella sp.]MDN6520015.1 hypothetical protein [Yaniella sp.]
MGTGFTTLAAGQVFDGHICAWTQDHVLADWTREPVDAVILATGTRPALPSLRTRGAIDAAGRPLHQNGVSRELAGLGFSGLVFQRSFSSNTLRGLHPDAAHVLKRLARQFS